MFEALNSISLGEENKEIYVFGKETRTPYGQSMYHIEHFALNSSQYKVFGGFKLWSVIIRFAVTAKTTMAASEDRGGRREVQNYIQGYEDTWVRDDYIPLYTRVEAVGW